MQAQVPAGSAIERSMPGYLSAGFPGIYRGIAANGAGHCANVEVPISQSNTGYPAKSACEVGSLTERCAEAFLVHRKELRIEGTMKASNHRSTPINPCLAILVALVVVAASSLERPSHGEPSNEEHQRFPCHETEISRTTPPIERARASGSMASSRKHPGKPSPARPASSTSFPGARRFTTRERRSWDETNLYVGFWIEEPHVRGNLTDHDA